MRTLPHILSEGLLTDKNISIQMNDLTARTVAAALYSPSDDTFKKIRAYLNRGYKIYGNESGAQMIDRHIRKQHEVLMTLAKISASAFFVNYRWAKYPAASCFNGSLKESPQAFDSVSP